MPNTFESYTSGAAWKKALKDETFEVLKANRYGQLQRRKVSCPLGFIALLSPSLSLRHCFRIFFAHPYTHVAIEIPTMQC